MEENQPSPSRRKVKFAPRSAPSRKPKTTTRKTEAGVEDDGECAQDQAGFRRWEENLARRAPKAETKSNVQVAFGPGASSTSSLRTYGNKKDVNSEKSSGSASKVSSRDENVLALPSTATAIEDLGDVLMVDATDSVAASAQKIKEEYKEPWDYQSSYYPTTLPLRKPNSGDPEILDEKEFGEAAARVEYDENTVNSAADLGLLDQSEQKRILLFKLPDLPFVKQSVSRKGKEKVGASEASTKGCTLEDLPGGFMGKMQVYKSGAVKLKLGETLFDVSPGTNCIFFQDVLAMNTAEKTSCALGKIEKRAVVTPDIDSIEL